MLILGISVLEKLVSLVGLIQLMEVNEYLFISIIEIIVACLSLMALNGYITKSYYFSRSIWVSYFCLLILSILYNVYDAYANGIYTNAELLSFLTVLITNDIETSYALVLLDSVKYGFVFPILYAVYKYAFNSKLNWVTSETT